MYVSSRKSKHNPVHRALYDGRERGGSVEERGKEFVARNRRGQILGAFPDAGAAADAITEEAAGAAACALVSDALARSHRPSTMAAAFRDALLKRGERS